MKKNVSKEILDLALELFIQTPVPKPRENKTHRYIGTPNTTKLLEILNYLKICHTNNVIPNNNSLTKLDEFLLAFYKEIYPHGTNITKEAVDMITNDVIKLFNSKLKEFDDQSSAASGQASMGFCLSFGSFFMAGGLPYLTIWGLSLHTYFYHPFFHSSTFTIIAYVYIALAAIGVLMMLLSPLRCPRQESFFKREIEPSLSRIIEKNLIKTNADVEMMQASQAGESSGRVKRASQAGESSGRVKRASQAGESSGREFQIYSTMSSAPPFDANHCINR